MKRLFTLALLAACCVAQATGTHTTPPPVAPPPPAPQTPSITADVRLRAQAQAAARSRSAARATGGQAAATGGSARAALRDSGNATVENTIVNPGGGNDFGGRVVIHPGMIPPSPMAMNPQGNLAVMGTGCGPLIQVNSEQVYATEPGLLNSSQVSNGRNVGIAGPKIGPMGEIIMYDEQRQADGSTVLIGNQLIVGMSITNQSGGANIAGGFIRSSGSGAQLGGGASAAMQQMGERVIAIPCIAAVIPAKVEPRVQFQSYIAPKKRRAAPPPCIARERICRPDRN